MASIRKRGQRYAVLYRDPTGKQRSETFARRKDAEHRKSEVEVDVRAGTFISPRDSRIAFGDWYERWEGNRHVSPARAAADASLRDVHVLPRWAKVPLDAITFMEVQGFVTRLSATHSPATVRACLKLVKLPLDAAVRDGKIRSNPALGVTVPAPTRRLQRSEDVLTADELAAVVSALPERWRALVFVTSWLGLRWSEAIGLRRQDYNPLRRRLTVGSVVVVEVEGRNVVREGGKTRSALRVLPVPEQVASVLDAHIETCAVATDGFLFTTNVGTLPLRTNFNRRTLAPALAAAGLAGRGITVRQLRHTGASLMLDAGLALQDVSQRMGHAKPSTTFDVYAHLLAERQDAGTSALDEAIRRAVAGRPL